MCEIISATFAFPLLLFSFRTRITPECVFILWFLVAVLDTFILLNSKLTLNSTCFVLILIQKLIFEIFL